MRYKLSDLEAEVIPKNYVSAAEPSTAALPTAGAAESGERVEPKGTRPDHVLVVEDNMIIAMDTEDCLRRLGVSVVTTAGSVHGALESLAQDAPDMAILDYNLGGETSDPVAGRLRELGIPFVLATGYGELEAKLAEIGARAILKKPYGKAEIAGALELIMGG